MNKIYILFISISFLCCTPPKNEITTFILVRHAEKVIEKNPDPLLTDRGILRANQLAEILDQVNIDVIYSTEFKRTLATINPISKAKNLSITKYEPKEFDELVKDILENHPGKTILISGHSNTTPRIVNALLASSKHPDLDESEYDWVYIVDVTEIGNASVKKLKLTL